MLNVFMLGLPWLFCKMFDIKTPPERDLDRLDLVFPHKVTLALRPRTASEKKLVRVLDRLFPFDEDEWEKAYTLLLEGKEFRFHASARQLSICESNQGDTGIFSKVSRHHHMGNALVNDGSYILYETGYCRECLAITRMWHMFDDEGECTECNNMEGNVLFTNNLTNAEIRKVEKLLSSPKAVKAAEEREAVRAEARKGLHEIINERANYH